jgi:hypothetical protein
MHVYVISVRILCAVVQLSTLMLAAGEQAQLQSTYAHLIAEDVAQLQRTLTRTLAK